MKKVIIISSIFSILFASVFFVLTINERCNIATIKIYGDLTTNKDGYIESDDGTYWVVSSENIVNQIKDVEKKSYIKGLVLDLNSNGGSIVAAEEIFRALRKLKIPTISLVRDGAYSSAYIVASAANKIVLNRSSEVGAIGVTASYLNKYEKNIKEGVVFQQLTSSKFKDLLNPNKELTSEEREIMQSIVNEVHENVIEMIAEGRSLGIEDVRLLADGSIFLGKNAIEKKLADELGDLTTAENIFKNIINKKIKLCKS